MINGSDDRGAGREGGGPDTVRRRPAGISDETVAALGKLSEALETVEQARGHLYGFHQLTGRADGMLDHAVSLLRRAGQHALAERVQRDLIGRNVLPGRWTFQLVEEYDDGYYATFKAVERDARNDLVGGRRHLYEAEMKQRRRSRGVPGHEARPDGDGEG